MRLTPGLKLKETKKEIVAHLVSFGIESGEARVEADMIVESVSGMSNSKQLVCDDLPMTERQLEKAERLLTERARRKPIQYCLGEAQFLDLKIKVREGVFIPRTDTETVVEAALDLARGLARSLPEDRPIKVLEIGVGSGAIAVGLLKKNDRLLVTGTDINEEALALTAENAALHRVADRLSLKSEGLWWTLTERFDLIVSNPPYIPQDQQSTLEPEVVDFEPHEALFGRDPDGLRFYRKLSTTAAELLDSTGGFIVVEVGDGQADPVKAIFAEAGWEKVTSLRDVNGISRVVTASRSIR